MISKCKRHRQNQNDGTNGRSKDPELLQIDSIESPWTSVENRQHGEIRSEEVQWEKDDGDDGECDNSSVKPIGRTGQFILLDCLEAEELVFVHGQLACLLRVSEKRNERKKAHRFENSIRLGEGFALNEISWAGPMWSLFLWKSTHRFPNPADDRALGSDAGAVREVPDLCPDARGRWVDVPVTWARDGLHHWNRPGRERGWLHFCYSIPSGGVFSVICADTRVSSWHRKSNAVN